MLTFQPRRGRVTPRQERALATLWPRFGVDVGQPGHPLTAAEAAAGPLDLPALFGRTAPLVVEVGSGMGEAAVAYAEQHPGHDVLAVDVHTPGLGALLAEVDQRGLTNLRAARGDALDVLRHLLTPASVAAVHAFFPDPWPKARHHKRRLVRADTVALIASRLVPGGAFVAATDWPDYAAAMLEVLGAEPLLVNPFGGFAPRPQWRPVTKFEAQARAAGRQVFEVQARRMADCGHAGAPGL